MSIGIDYYIIAAQAPRGIAARRRLARAYYAIIEYYISLSVLLPFGGKRRTPRT